LRKKRKRNKKNPHNPVPNQPNPHGVEKNFFVKKKGPPELIWAQSKGTPKQKTPPQPPVHPGPPEMVFVFVPERTSQKHKDVKRAPPPRNT